MGITTALEDETGDKIDSVEDPTDMLHHALPHLDDPQFQWANTIDWYGDTVFNPVQAGLLRKEWALLIDNAEDEEAAMLLKRIDALLLKCAAGVHLYVKFWGD